MTPLLENGLGGRPLEAFASTVWIEEPSDVVTDLDIVVDTVPIGEVVLGSCVDDGTSGAFPDCDDSICDEPPCGIPGVDSGPPPKAAIMKGLDGPEGDLGDGGGDIEPDWKGDIGGGERRGDKRALLGILGL